MDVNLLGFVKFAIPISLEQAIQIISIVVQFLAIVASGLYVGWQIKGAKQSEIDFRVHEQRKEQYSKLIDLLKDVLVSVKDTKIYEINATEWINVQMGMSLYASGKVLKAYINLLKSSQENKDSSIINRQIGDLILQMRKEVGLEDSNLTSRDVLSTFVNDIDDPKYDQYFK